MMRDIPEIMLICAILGWSAYLITQAGTPPTTCQQVLQ